LLKSPPLKKLPRLKAMPWLRPLKAKLLRLPTPLLRLLTLLPLRLLSNPSGLSALA
jgi:hypothetical protein